MSEERDYTLRRTIQQIAHCALEALAVIENDEDPRCAEDDLRQAGDLIDVALNRIRRKQR